MIRAFFQDTTPEGDLNDLRQFTTQVSKAYGPGALRKLDELLGAVHGTLPGWVKHNVAGRIFPTAVDRNFNVIEVGFLDTDSLVAK
jgi:hypothetical protein